MANEYYAVVHCDSLQHHGIKGQKWGVRRFQNEDGSYTAAGQSRRNLAVRKKKKSPTKKVSEKKSTIGSTLRGAYIKRKLQTASAKSIAKSNISDAELDRYVKRIKMANDYKNILAKEKENAPITKGKKIVTSILKGLGKSAGILKDAAIRGLAKKIENSLSKTSDKKPKVNSTELYEDMVSGRRDPSSLTDDEFKRVVGRYGSDYNNQNKMEERIREERGNRAAEEFYTKQSKKTKFTAGKTANGSTRPNKMKDWYTMEEDPYISYMRSKRKKKKTSSKQSNRPSSSIRYLH